MSDEQTPRFLKFASAPKLPGNEKYNLRCPYHALRMKRLFDPVVASAAIFMLSPILAIVAFFMLLKLGQPGPVPADPAWFETRSFEMIEFRTMPDCVDADGQPLADHAPLTQPGRLRPVDDGAKSRSARRYSGGR